MKTVLKVVSLSALALLTPPALFLVYSAYFKKKGCVCPFYFWKKRNNPNLPSESCNVCWRPKNILSEKYGLRWPYRFRGFLPPSFTKVDDGTGALQNGKYIVNGLKEPFWPESSVLWLQQIQDVRQGWDDPNLYRLSVWRYSLLRGAGRLMFNCGESNNYFMDEGRGIVEKYFVSAIPGEESVSLFIANTETRESRVCLLDPTPPKRNLMDEDEVAYFNVAEFFNDSIVLVACEFLDAWRRRLWAYKYVPDKKNLGIWSMKSARKMDVLDADAD